jgi:predicted methyltransferase
MAIINRITFTVVVISLYLSLIIPAGVHAAEETAAVQLTALANGAHRTAEQRARNRDRHPVETLTFFGIDNDMTVVELWPFGGWYASILAPLLRDNGKYYTAAMDPETTQERELNYNKQLQAMFEAEPALYDKVVVTALVPGNRDIAPAGTADMVLTFRNIHNWEWAGIGKAVFTEAYKALKPGGILGVVEHRADPDNVPELRPGMAYVGEDYAIELIESAGFVFLGSSEINANPQDTKDHPRGVWTLPPNYALGDQDRDKYTAMGESDRFTLKFMKPAAD